MFVLSKFSVSKLTRARTRRIALGQSLSAARVEVLLGRERGEVCHGREDDVCDRGGRVEHGGVEASALVVDAGVKIRGSSGKDVRSWCCEHCGGEEEGTG
jgi:hypothetical protein